ncbi:MAG: hypothetical protein WAR59_16380 [Ignavibacteriaceae bacterium]
MKIKSVFFIILLILISITSNASFSQNLFKINEDIGGGGSNNSNVAESNDNTMLYVVGGAVVVGIVIYALLKDKKEKPKDDTTAVTLNDEFLEKQLTLSDQILKYQSQIPINISIGMQKDIIRNDDKRYFVGLNYNF